MGIASPPAAARNDKMGRVEEFKFPEGKIHYLK
jgi:hypothetical protein